VFIYEQPCLLQLHCNVHGIFSNKEYKMNAETSGTRNNAQHFFILVDLFLFLFLFLFYFKCKCSCRSSSHTSKRIRLFKRKPLFSNKCTRGLTRGFGANRNHQRFNEKIKIKIYINYLDLSNHFSPSLIISAFICK